MTAQNPLSTWRIPSSSGIGVDYYYKDILKADQEAVNRGYNYTQEFIREQIAKCDAEMLPKYKSIYDEDQLNRAEDRPKISWAGLFGILEDGGVSKEVLDQIEPYLAHTAYKRGEPLDFLVVKEFLAYCGIEGVYDLEAGKHFPVERRVESIPSSVLPSQWQADDELRLSVARLMDVQGEMKVHDTEISQLNRSVWSPYASILEKDVRAGKEIDDVSHRQAYVDAHPELAGSMARLEAIKAERQSIIEAMKDKYAPVDPKFKLPSLGTPYDRNWHQQHEKALNRRTFYKDRLQAYHKNRKIKSGDPDHLSFDWQKIRVRALAASDWALRDFITSKVNRGVNAEYRRHDVPRSFVKAVLDEREDGLLSIIKTPYRIEFTDDARTQFQVIFNDVVVETSTLEAVLEMQEKHRAEDIVLAAENSDLVKVHDIPPVEQVTRESIPVNYALTQSRPGAPTITYIDTDLDELEGPELQMSKNEQQNAVVTEAEGAQANEPVAQPGAVGDSQAPGASEHVGNGSSMTADDNTPPVANDPAQVAQQNAPAAQEDTSSAPVQKSTVEPEEEDLPFPDSPVGFQDEDKPQAKKQKPDDVALQFNVAPPSKATEKETAPAKTTDTAAKPSDRSNLPKVELPPKREASTSPSKEGNGAYERDGTRLGKHSRTPMSPEDALRLMMEKEKARTGGGQGMGMGGMGGMGMNRLPPTYNVDLGLSTLFGGIRQAGSSLVSALTPKRSSPGAKVSAQATKVREIHDSFKASTAMLTDARQRLETGKDEFGKDSTPEDVKEDWAELNSSLKGLGKATSEASWLKEGQISPEMANDLKKAQEELKSTKKFVDDAATKPGLSGEMAKKAQETLKKVTEALEMLLKALMKLFSRNKSAENAPSP